MSDTRPWDIYRYAEELTIRNAEAAELRRELEEVKRELWGAERRVVNLGKMDEQRLKYIEHLEAELGKHRDKAYEAMNNPSTKRNE